MQMLHSEARHAEACSTVRGQVASPRPAGGAAGAAGAAAEDAGMLMESSSFHHFKIKL